MYDSVGVGSAVAPCAAAVSEERGEIGAHSAAGPPAAGNGAASSRRGGDGGDTATASIATTAEIRGRGGVPGADEKRMNLKDAGTSGSLAFKGLMTCRKLVTAL
ncbi:Protein of unknown function [Gryllus bimaculatus]|nr:Protein of unknown function [Gryllus bimaculatus]